MLQHLGWSIQYKPGAPITGRWQAKRFGVGMCAGTREALFRMIEVKNSER